MTGRYSISDRVVSGTGSDSPALNIEGTLNFRHFGRMGYIARTRASEHRSAPLSWAPSGDGAPSPHV